MLNSFDNFVDMLGKFQKTYRIALTEEIELVLQLSNITCGSPPCLSDCLEQGLTYEVPLVCTASSEKQLRGKSDGQRQSEIYLCRLPVMVGSKLCTEGGNDMRSGTFVINGQSKVLLMSKTRRKNKLIVYELDEEELKAEAKVISYRGKLAFSTRVQFKQNTLFVNLGRSTDASKTHPLAHFLSLFEADIQQSEQVLKRGLTSS